MRARTSAAALAAALGVLVLPGCSAQPTPTPVRASPTAEGGSPVAPGSTAPDQWKVMPDVRCMNLQEAQDRIQELGVFYSRSVDATGQGRRQIVDSNWIVVGQEPVAGTPINEGDAVLSVVKTDEPNDC